MIKKIKSFFKANELFFKIAWKGHKSYFFLYLVTVFYSVANNMVLVYLPKLSLRCFLEKKDFVQGVLFIVGWIIFSVTWSFCERKIALKQSLNVTKIAIKMQNEIYYKIKSNNMLPYENSEQYDKIQRAINYTENGADEIVNVVSRLLTAILTLIGVSYVIFEVSPFILLVIIASLILAHVCMSKVNTMWFNYQNIERLPKVRLVNYLSGTFNNKDFVTDYKVNNAIDFFVSTTQNKKLNLAEESAKKNWRSFRWNFVAILLNNIQLLAAHIYFGYLLFHEIISIATYSSLFVALQQFSSNFGSLLSILIELKNKIAESSYYLDFLNDNSFIQDGTKKLTHLNSIIINHLSFKYPESQEFALDDVSFKINEGDKIAIVGENGSGKTTLIKVLLGLFPPTSGSIIINDEINFSEIELASWYNLIGSVMQNSICLPVSVKENIALRSNEDIISGKIDESIEFAGLREKIDSLPKRENTVLSTRFDKEGTDFSGGEKQKVLIARAYYNNKDILIFDEPSSALDPNSEYELFQDIYNLGHRKTVIFVSHRLATVIKADRIIVLDKGKIVETGSHKELLSNNGHYAEMYRKYVSNYMEEAE